MQLYVLTERYEEDDCIERIFIKGENREKAFEDKASTLLTDGYIQRGKFPVLKFVRGKNDWAEFTFETKETED